MKLETLSRLVNSLLSSLPLRPEHRLQSTPHACVYMRAQNGYQLYSQVFVGQAFVSGLKALFFNVGLNLKACS